MSILNFPSIKTDVRLIHIPKGFSKDKTYFSAKIFGNFYRGFGIYDGDSVICEKSESVKNGDMAIVDFNNQQIPFLVFFVSNKVILFGEHVELIDRKKVNFIGRVIRLERDF